MCLLCYFDLDQCCLIVEISWTAFRKGNCVFFQLNSYVIKDNWNCHQCSHFLSWIQGDTYFEPIPAQAPAPALHSWHSSTPEAKDPKLVRDSHFTGHLRQIVKIWKDIESLGDWFHQSSQDSKFLLDFQTMVQNCQSLVALMQSQRRSSFVIGLCKCFCSVYL